MNNGWIKLHRSLLDWEWYSDMNVRVVFIHCLLKANCKDIRYKGKDILRGSFATGLHLLSKEVGLTVAQIRVTLNKLKMTNDIAIKTSAEGSIISVTNYNQYQGNDKPNDKPIASEMTNESQTNDKPIATNKNIKNEKNKEKDTIVSKKKVGETGVIEITNTEFEKLKTKHGEKLDLVIAEYENWFTNKISEAKRRNIKKPYLYLLKWDLNKYDKNKGVENFNIFTDEELEDEKNGLQ